MSKSMRKIFVKGKFAIQQWCNGIAYVRTSEALIIMFFSDFIPIRFLPTLFVFLLQSPNALSPIDLYGQG